MNPGSELLAAMNHSCALEYRSALRRLDSSELGMEAPSRAVDIGTFRGKLLFSEVGDGEGARTAFEGVVRIGADAPTSCRESVANCIENMMTLSLSYDEFFEWTRALTKLQPDNPILHVLVPQVRKLQDEGKNWCSVLLWLAVGSAKMDNSPTDPKQYGCAASRYMLVCTHRKQLRPDKSQWKLAVINYSVATFRQRNRAMREMLGRGLAARRINEELRLIVDPQEKFCSEYLKQWPGDAEVEARLNEYVKDRNDFERNADELRAEMGLRPIATSGAYEGGGVPDRSPMNQSQCRQCGSTLDGSATCPECGAPQWGTLSQLWISSFVALGFGIGYFETPIWKWLFIAVGGFLFLGALSGVGLVLRTRAESFKGQIRDVRTFLDFVRSRNDTKDICSFYETRRNDLDMLGEMLFLSELAKDPLIVLAHGKGPGHAFARLPLLLQVISTHPGEFEDYADLVRECRKRGYRVKRFRDFRATREK